MLMQTIIQSRSNALGYNKPCPQSIFAAPLLAQEVTVKMGVFTNGLSVMVDVPKCQSHIPMQDIIDKFLMGSEAKAFKSLILNKNTTSRFWRIWLWMSSKC